MKKILAVCLTFAMLMSFTGSICVLAEPGHNTMVFLPENFTLPENEVITNANGTTRVDGWEPFNSSSTGDAFANNNGDGYWAAYGAIYKHFLRSIKGAWYCNRPATADFYLAEAGTYYIWSLAFCNASNPAEMRHHRIGFDGGWDGRLFTCTSSPDNLTKDKIEMGFKWVRSSSSYELVKGWHKLNIKIPTTVNGTNMIVITTDPDLVFDENTTWADVAPYTDITKPSWQGAITTEYVNPVSIDVTIPEIVEANIAEIKYFINGEQTESLVPGVNRISGLRPLSNAKIKAEAADKYGNKAVVLEKEISMSTVENSGFTFCDSSANAIEGTDLTGLTHVGIKMNACYKGTGSVVVGMGVGIYEKATGRMVDFKWTEKTITQTTAPIQSDVLTLSADVTSQPSNYLARAYVWEETSENIYSSPVVASIELGGEQQ